MDEEKELNEIDDFDFIITDLDGICPDLGDLLDNGLIPCILTKDIQYKEQEQPE